jgi:hypothetical protein
MYNEVYINGPAEAATSPSPAHKPRRKENIVGKSRIARVALPFTLRRVHRDGTEEPVSGHPDFGSGWSAGQEAVHQDRAGAYSLYRGDRRVARFAHARLQPRRSADTLDWSVIG